ncbi:hypothetical protein [Undibacterium sp.]|uniref:hypothetical protein n=1 Tax=Undibacterium sp. TaxID=1914977 RepID=UPI0025F48CA5|nr:hypothetical protein [Undibacterium sp.]
MALKIKTAPMMRKKLKITVFVLYLAMWISVFALSWIYWVELSWLEQGFLIFAEIFLAPDLASVGPILCRLKNTQ